jgi:hypothetical protein
VYVGNPRSAGEDEAGAVNGITGHSINQLNTINEERIYWGSLPPDPKLVEDLDRVIVDNLVNANSASSQFDN